ncbi:MAG: hypothetical protein KGY99_09890 [Phycisphaerae bacterium]|nr:hypothetical protein [Phycisphaerae bacterium]
MARTARPRGPTGRAAWVPTVEHPEDISAFAIYGADEKRAKAMAEEKVYPDVVAKVLTDEQRETLEAAQQD